MLRIALRMIAQRPAAMIATAVALWIAVVVVTSCGVLLESGVRYHGTVARYAAAPVLVATTSVQVVEGSGEDREVDGTRLDGRGPLPAGLPARIAALPEVGTAVTDAAVPAQILRSGNPVAVELHPWAAAALAPYRLVAGRVPAGPADVVVDRRLGAVGERIALPGLGTRTVTGTTGPTGDTPTVFTAGLPGPAQVSACCRGRASPWPRSRRRYAGCCRRPTAPGRSRGRSPGPAAAASSRPRWTRAASSRPSCPACSAAVRC